jgi:hypothetical protein
MEKNNECHKIWMEKPMENSMVGTKQGGLVIILWSLGENLCVKDVRGPEL